MDSVEVACGVGIAGAVGGELQLIEVSARLLTLVCQIIKWSEEHTLIIVLQLLSTLFEMSFGFFGWVFAAAVFEITTASVAFPQALWALG